MARVLWISLIYSTRCERVSNYRLGMETFEKSAGVIAWLNDKPTGRPIIITLHWCMYTVLTSTKADWGCPSDHSLAIRRMDGEPFASRSLAFSPKKFQG